MFVRKVATVLALVSCGVQAFLVPSAMTAGPKRFSRTACTMSVQVGDKLPLTTTFQELVDGKPSDVSALELFAGKKVVLVGVPGAHTPTCSEVHVPGFLQKADEFFAKGVDSIVVLSVNDCFVMNSWFKALGGEGSKVRFLADGGAAFTKASGLEFDTGNFGGIRIQRLSALLEDGVVKKIHLEGGGGLTTATAEVLLSEI